jgi:hypothetical protein
MPVGRGEADGWPPRAPVRLAKGRERADGPIDISAAEVLEGRR